MDAGYLAAWGILSAFGCLTALLVTGSLPVALAVALLAWCLAALLAWAEATGEDCWPWG